MMTKDQSPTEPTPEAISNQDLAQHLLAQGLPAQSADMLQIFMNLLANETANRLAQGGSLEDCFALMDRYVHYESVRQRAIATSLRVAKAGQPRASAKATPQETPTVPARKDIPVPSASITPPPPDTPQRTPHLSRQQRRALLRKQMQAAGSTHDTGNAS